MDLSERFQTMSKKYMCNWMPVEALSVCVTKASGNENLNAIDCLLCVAKTAIGEADCLWTAKVMPPQTPQAVEYLENLRASHEHIKIAFQVMAKKFKPSFCYKSEEIWANNIEVLLGKLKEDKASE